MVKLLISTQINAKLALDKKGEPEDKHEKISLNKQENQQTSLNYMWNNAWVENLALSDTVWKNKIPSGNYDNYYAN